MPDSDFDAPSGGAVRVQANASPPPAATHSLRCEILRRAEMGLAFPEFMRMALYDPQDGYYARHARQVGRAGDFFTSVSVGPVFGKVLARRFLRWWRESGCPDSWRVVELGAHDGTLANDVLGEISCLDAAAWAAMEYVIIEPLGRLRASQQSTLAGHGARVAWVADVDELHAKRLPGIVFGNELLDALPFHVVTREDGKWCEMGVNRVEDGLKWCSMGPVEGDLAVAVARIDAERLADGYQTEVRTNFESLHRALAGMLEWGMVVWLDYGFARPEYYDPARTKGTLRTFSRHRAGEDPLENPGTVDITAHVDFTAVAEAAAAAGFGLGAFLSQGAWLTREARELLMAWEVVPDAAGIRQFQTLTHPAHLGARFHVIELATPGSSRATAADIHRCGLT